MAIFNSKLLVITRGPEKLLISSHEIPFNHHEVTIFNQENHSSPLVISITGKSTISMLRSSGRTCFFNSGTNNQRVDLWL